MDLKIITLSEVSQTNIKSYAIAFKWNLKDSTNELT